MVACAYPRRPLLYLALLSLAHPPPLPSPPPRQAPMIVGHSRVNNSNDESRSASLFSHAPLRYGCPQVSNGLKRSPTECNCDDDNGPGLGSSSSAMSSPWDSAPAPGESPVQFPVQFVVQNHQYDGTQQRNGKGRHADGHTDICFLRQRR